MSLFFSPQGRIGRGTFWLGAIVLLVIGCVLAAVQVYGPQSLALVLGALSLALIYPQVCVYVKRFHDAGKSGWWFLLVLLLGAVVAGGGQFALMAPRLGELQAQPGTPEFQAQMMALQQELLAPTIGISVVVSLVLILIVGLLPSDPGENRFGPPTSGATPAA